MKTDFDFDLASLGTSDDTSYPLAAPLVRIWLLRMLVLFGKHEYVLDPQGGANRRLLTHSIGIAHWREASRRHTPRKALSELRRMLKQTGDDPANHLAPAPLARNARQVASLLGLSDVERRLLEFAVLLHSESALEVGCAGLLGSLGAWQISPILAMLLDLPEPDVRAALSPKGVLTQSGLITLERGDKSYLGEVLSLMPGIGGHMLSQEADTLGLFRDAFSPAQAAELAMADFAHIRPGLDILLPYLNHALANARHGVNVYLHGLPGTGKSQLTRTLAHELGASLFIVSTETDEGNPIDGEKRLRALRAAQYVLKASRALLVFITGPLGIAGVAAALLLLNRPFGFVALLGVIALMGMIQRNSVILIDQIEKDRERGVPTWDAIVEAAVRRLRPIVLTAAAAVLAMVPLSRSVFWGPMAVAIMGGLIVATALTLLALPAMYAAWFRVRPPARENPAPATASGRASAS